MSKTIKIGDFIERLNNLDFKTGTKIKFQDKIYLYDYPNLTGIYEIGKPSKREYSLFAQLNITNLHSPVEIIEEQKEIDIQNLKETNIEKDCSGMEYYTYSNKNNTETRYSVDYSASDIETRKKINELVQAVKYLDNKLKEK